MGDGWADWVVGARRRDVLEMCLGCAGWEVGQLEDELKENAWLTVEGQSSVLFDTPPAERLTAAAGILGVDLNLMTRNAGHA